MESRGCKQKLRLWMRIHLHHVAECAPTKLRGSFVGRVSQFGYHLGTLIASGLAMEYPSTSCPTTSLGASPI
ncbi:Major facilitator superfamily domain general substrate transporter [Penicillium freii]|nr:Major facilitator superfamily domain general substrate transporter [Penicillium freii]